MQYLSETEMSHLVNNHGSEIFEDLVEVLDGSDYLQYFFVSLFNDDWVLGDEALQLWRRKLLQQNKTFDISNILSLIGYTCK